MEALKNTSPANFFGDMFETPEEKREMCDFMKRRSVVSRLASVRAAKGITQTDLGKAAGCTQGAISKLEAGPDSAVTLAHLEAYAKATGSEITILISDRKKSLADQVKHHAFSIRAAFLKLVKLAHMDNLIAQGVAQLHAEAFENINRFLSETAQQLPVNSDNGMPLIQIVAEDLEPDDCEQPAKISQAKTKTRRIAKTEEEPVLA